MKLQVRMKLLPILLFAAAAAVSMVSAQDAEQLMERARIAATLQHNDLKGHLEKKGGPKSDVLLYLKGKEIQFQYLTKGSPWSIFHMRLGRGEYDLFEIKGGKTFRFPDEKLSQPVAGTDLSFEDLSLRFFYWPKPKIEGARRYHRSPGPRRSSSDC